MRRVFGEARLPCVRHRGIDLAGVVGRALVQDEASCSREGAKRTSRACQRCSMTMHQHHHEQLPSEEEIAVKRIRRVTQRATDRNAGDYLERWLKDTIQRWWMSHRLIIEDPCVLEAFCDAVDASLAHLPYSPEMRRLMTSSVADLRRGGLGTYAMARFIIIELDLDPDATPRSLLVWEWEQVDATSCEDPDRDAAAYLATLTRHTLQMIADPELYEEERAELIHLAVNGLRSVARARQHLNDLWAAVGTTLCEYADGNVARVARLHVTIDELEVIASEPY